MTTGNLTREPGAGTLGLGTVLGHLDEKFRVTAAAAVRAVAREARAVGAADAERGSRRRLALKRMEDEVRAVEHALTASRDELGGLTTAPRVRPVSHDEADRVRALRWRTEHLRWQLDVLRDQFEQIRGEPPPR